MECGQGQAPTRRDCAAVGQTCSAGYGCVACHPGVGTCSGGNTVACRADGSGMQQFECDPAQGMACEPDGCKGPCSPTTLGSSYVGCDYYPTVTLNTGVWSGFAYAVAVANTSAEPASVLVTRGDATVRTLVVPAGGLEVIELPWVPELKGPDPNLAGQPQQGPAPAVVRDGAYRLRTDRPVTVYQFSPLDYTKAPAPADCPDPFQASGCFSFSNDASLLLPTHVLSGDYVAMSWDALGCRSGFITITATADDTVVELAPLGEFEPGAGIDELGQGKARLDAGDVLQLVSRANGGPFCFNVEGSDMSGTRVHASKPVQVISGHACANLPTPKTEACDHLEEAMFPVETLGKSYVVTVPTAPGGPSPYTLRVAAVEPGTRVSFDPPVEVPTALEPGKPLEIRYLEEDVRVSADKPVLVAQFMQGSHSVPSRTGDPSQSLAIATEQFRTSYVFVAPANYDQSYVNVVATAGQDVVLDGTSIPTSEFTPVGASEHVATRVLLDGRGVHTMESSEPFGITVYGYGTYTSYMYPGGLDLRRFTPPPVF